MQFTLCRGPTVQTEMSLATAGIHCTIRQRLSGATEDCSIVRKEATLNENVTTQCKDTVFDKQLELY